MDETTITSNIPTLDMTIVRRKQPEENAETITVNLRATPDLATVGKGVARSLCAPAVMWALPFAATATVASAMWRPWLGMLAPNAAPARKKLES